MNSLCQYCCGESHKSINKPCQDYAYAESSEQLSMAIVSDGHGGERYFRSQYGSEIAVKVTADAIRAFVDNMEQSSLMPRGKRSVFDDAPFTAYSSALAIEQTGHKVAHKALQWLFSHIITQWNLLIARHARENALSEWELEHVERQYQEEFIGMLQSEEASFEKTYGCTLMAYVQTPTYWFAFHLGDGKCVLMRLENQKLVCEQPIPWDEKCFLNKTTSLCDSNALEEFRYCYQGNGEFPQAVFLGSDGVDDSYGDGENLNDFYIRLFKLIIRKGEQAAAKELRKSLPLISKIGSKDDMSVACVYNDSHPEKVFKYLTDYQQELLLDVIVSTKEKEKQLVEKIASYGHVGNLNQSQVINRKYAENDLRKIMALEAKLKKKLIALKGEITRFNNRNKKDNK